MVIKTNLDTSILYCDGHAQSGLTVQMKWIQILACPGASGGIWRVSPFFGIMLVLVYWAPQKDLVSFTTSFTIPFRLLASDELP